MMPTTKAMLEAQGQLHANSEIKNLGWIIALFQELLQEARRKNLLETIRSYKGTGSGFFAGDVDLYLQHYAAQCSIVLSGIETIDPAGFKMPDFDAEDPWGWESALMDYERRCMIPPIAYRGRRPLGYFGLD
jgi:hypothetical protein